MATGRDKVAGFGLMSFASFVLMYYTIWIIVLPFVDETHVIQGFFLPKPYAFYIPAMAAVLIFTIALFVMVIFFFSQQRPITYKGD